MEVQCTTPWSNLAESRCGCVRTCHVSLRCGRRNTVGQDRKGKETGELGGAEGRNKGEGINDRETAKKLKMVVSEKRDGKSDREKERQSAAKSGGR